MIQYLKSAFVMYIIQFGIKVISAAHNALNHMATLMLKPIGSQACK